MNWRRNMWVPLGITPTDDVSAIRRAYAEKLKAMDPDADPDAFMALRNARDFALAEARRGAVASYDEAEEEAWDEWDEDEDEAADEPAEASPAIDAAASTGGANPLAPPQLSAPQTEGTLGARPAAPAEDYRSADPNAPRPATGEAPDAVPLSQRRRPLVNPRAPGNPAVDATIRAFEPPAPDPAQAIAEILLDHAAPQSVEASNAEAAALLRYFAAVQRDPRLAEIGTFADAERWFARLIAHSIPRSDVLVRPAAEFFRWDVQGDDVHADPAVAAVCRRYREFAFVDAVREKSHRLNGAWRELTKPAYEKTRLPLIGRGRVRELLDLVRSHYPGVEDWFDYYRVGLWDESLAGGAQSPVSLTRGIFFGLWLLLLVVRAFSSGGGSSAPPPVPVFDGNSIDVEAIKDSDIFALKNERGDIDSALAQATSDAEVKLTEVEKTNPRFATLLHSNWQVAHDEKRNIFKFRNDMHSLIDERYNRGWRRGDYGLLVEHQQLIVDFGKALRAESAAHCDDWFAGRETDWGKLPSPLIDRWNQHRRRVLLETDGDPPAKSESGRYTIPGEVMTAIGKRAGLTRAQLDKGLDGKASSDINCRAELALRETALALPQREAAYLLRHM